MSRFAMNGLLVGLCLTAGAAQAEVTITEGTIDLPSYAISAPEKSPVFDCKWSYQRARRSIYPYALNDNLTARKAETKTWKALYLENEWVKVCVLPEIGGRLFYAIDKTNGYDIFYRQDAIKPANVGMNGAWISGGVEWNVFHHHRISTQMPCDWRLVKNADGSATIWLGETERRHRMSWAIGITLRPGNACMEIDGRLVNCTEDSNSMLFWANVATHANPDYQIIFPQNTEFAAYHAKSSICHWPVSTEAFTDVDAYTNHVDVSWWKNHTVGNSLFAWELPENFIGGYDHGKDAGTMLVGNRHIIRGGKFWSWGPNSGWPTKILTDARGHYVELMVGAYTDSQPDYNWSAPGETKVFKQYWYGVKGMKGIKLGDETCAINMEKSAKDKLFLALNSCRTITNVTVKVLRKGEPFYAKTFDAAPNKPWSTTVDVPADVPETDFTMQTWCGREKRLKLSYTPVKHDLKKPCPAEVKTPKRPKDIASTEECYYVGLRAEQFHQPYVDANDYYEEVLRRDPLDVRANTRLGIYWRRHWDLAKAEKHLRAALVRQTKDYTRVKDGEAMYNLGLVLAEKGDVEGAIKTLYRAVWTYEYNSAANLKLARLYAAKGDFAMALDRVNEAIVYNGNNLDAKGLKASLLKRGLGVRAENRDAGQDEAIQALTDVLTLDPLNAYALYELKGGFLNDDPESALELALKFKANGFPDEAKMVLETIDAKVAHPGVKLHLGKVDEFLKMDLADWRPFRRETKDLLEKLKVEKLKVEGLKGIELAKVEYCLGNVYGNVDTAKAMSAWSKSVEQSNNQTIKQSNNSLLPYALRNLGYGHWKWTKDFKKSLDFYRRAIAAKPDEAFFLEEFDHVAEEAKRPVAERYQMLKSHHATAAKRSGSLVAECVTGTFCGDYDYVLGLMRTQYFPTFEGAANFHDVYMDALIGKGGRENLMECFEFPEAHQVFVYDKRRPRDAQLWYLIGEYGKSAAVDTLRTDWCYWKALSLRKLGREAEARAIGEAMVRKGSAKLDDYVDFFDYEGNRYGTTKDAKNAAAAYTRGLGKLLLGDRISARECFEECLALKPDHFWAKQMRREAAGVTEVLFSFDTEDFTDPDNADAIRELADLCTEEGVTASFETVGLLAEQLENWGRKDVIAAMRRHLIGTHSYGHSVHPNIMEMSATEDYATAYRSVRKVEEKCVANLRRLFGAERLWTSAPAGNSEPYVAGRVYADLGIQLDLGACYLGRSGRDAWFGGQYRLPYALCMDVFFEHDSDFDVGKILDKLATGTRLCVYTHPNKVRSTLFWDGLNYEGSNACARGKWKLPPRREAADVTRGYARMRQFIRALKADPRFRLVSAGEIAAELRPRVAITRADVPRLRAALEKKLGPVDAPASWCVSDVFCAAVAFLRGEQAYRPDRAYGFLYAPEGVTNATTVAREDLVAAAKAMDITGFLPHRVDVGGLKLGPADFLFAALEALETGAATVTVKPREQLGEFDVWPRLANVRYSGTWMHAPDFDDTWPKNRIKWQLWTLRFEPPVK